MAQASTLCAAALLLAGFCLSTLSGDGPFEVAVLEDAPSFDSTGVYFRADERTGLRSANTEDAEALLSALRERGVDFEAAFFRHRSNECSRPGSLVGQRMVVPAQLLLHVSAPATASNLPGMFKRVTGPPELTCPYGVVRFRPRKP